VLLNVLGCDAEQLGDRWPFVEKQTVPSKRRERLSVTPLKTGVLMQNAVRSPELALSALSSAYMRHKAKCLLLTAFKKIRLTTDNWKPEAKSA
jgi:hypothetical protein